MLLQLTVADGWKKDILVQSNLAIRNVLFALKLFLNAKSSLSLWRKWQIGHRKWFLNTNLFLISKFDCTYQMEFAIFVHCVLHQSLVTEPIKKSAIMTSCTIFYRSYFYTVWYDCIFFYFRFWFYVWKLPIWN